MAGKIKTFVTDSSVVMAILMPDEKKSVKSLKLAELIASNNKIIAPTLLTYEIGNSLRSAILSKRITKEDAEFLFNTFIQLKIDLVKIEIKSVFKLAIKHDITFYDASYSYLAKINKCKLLTLDKKLEEIAK